MTPDPSPSGETWVCRAAKGYTRCDVLPCTVRGYPEHKRCGPVPSSDTPSDERDEVCGSMGPRIGDEPERPRCAQPLDHDGQHRGFPGSGFESVQWGGPIVRDGDFARTYRPAPPPTPVDGDSGEALRFTAEVQGERMIYVLVTDHGDSGETYSAGPFTDEDHAAPRPDVAAALAAQINRSSPPVGEERRPVDVTALPEWAALVAAVENASGRMGARWMMPVGDRAIALVGASRRLAAADRGDRA